MSEPTHQIMGVTVEPEGVEAEPLYITVQGAMVRLEVDGVEWSGFIQDVREALS